MNTRIVISPVWTDGHGAQGLANNVGVGRVVAQVTIEAVSSYGPDPESSANRRRLRYLGLEFDLHVSFGQSCRLTTMLSRAGHPSFRQTTSLPGVGWSKSLGGRHLKVNCLFIHIYNPDFPKLTIIAVFLKKMFNSWPPDVIRKH